MNFKTTIVLLIVLLAVGAGLYFTRETGTKTETVTAPEKLLSVSAPDVQTVSITADDGQHMVLERKGTNWQLTQPVNAPADETAVTSLVDTLTSMQTKGKADLGGTGLDSPRWKIELTTRDNKTTKVDVGSRSGAGDNLYVRLDGQSQADVVPTELYDELDKPLERWRREKLFDVSGSDIKQVRIASTQPTLELQKTGSKWKITQPKEMPADSYEASDVAMAAANLQAVDFVTQKTSDTKRYGLEDPVLSVSFSTQAPPAPPPATQPTTAPTFTTIKFGRFDDVLKKNIYASISTEPGVFKVAASSLDAFRKKPLELRDKELLSIDPDKVTKIAITTDKPATTQPTTRPAVNQTVVIERSKHGTGTMGAPAPSTAPTTSPTTLASSSTSQPTTGPSTAQASTQPAREPSKWNVASSGGVDADDSKVQTLLSELHPLRVDKYLEEAEQSPTTQPAATYTLAIDTTDEHHEIRLTDPGSGKQVVGQYNGLSFEVSHFIVDKLEGDFVRSEKSEPASDTKTPPLPMMPNE